jgi:putative PIN family toxin of toxin-antitoxin system
MRVILDTNIFLSALISPGGTPDQIYHAWRDRKFILVTSVAQLDELRRASHYPKLRAKISTHRFGELINAINGAAVLDRLPEAAGLADPHDEFLLGMASAGQADYLVTGDGRSGLLQRGHAGRTRIVTPAQFLAERLA